MPQISAEGKVFLQDLQTYAENAGPTGPEVLLPIYLEGKIRDEWAEVYDANVIAYDRPMSWAETRNQFLSMIGEDLHDNEHDARMRMLSLPGGTAMKSDEEVTTYVTRFRANLTALGTGQLPATLQVHLFTQGLTDPYKVHLASLNHGKPFLSLIDTIRAVNDHARAMANLTPPPKRAQAAMAVSAMPMPFAHPAVFNMGNAAPIQPVAGGQRRGNPKKSKKGKQPSAAGAQAKAPPKRAGKAGTDYPVLDGPVMGYVNVRAAQDVFREKFKHACWRCGSTSHMRPQCDKSGPIGPYITAEEIARERGLQVRYPAQARGN